MIHLYQIKKEQPIKLYVFNNPLDSEKCFERFMKQ